MKKKILIISKCPTHPTNAGNRYWILSQAELLMELGHEVHFLYIQELPMRRDITPYKRDFAETKKYWKDRFHLYKVSKIQKLIFNIRKKFDEVFCNSYYSIDEVYPKGLTEYVNDLNRKFLFDICIINYVFLTKLFTKIKISKKAIFTHDCLAYRNLKVGESCRTMTAHQEAIGLQRCSHIFALQDEEMAYFHLLSPNSQVYNVYCRYAYHPQLIAGNRNILFLSGNNEYNQNGLEWFIKNIWPAIVKRFSDARLLVGGSICNVLKNTDGDRINFLGYIDRLFDFYALGDVAINPVYQGTGLKIKTFEAISYDKVTMVHPHSIAGIFKKETAPLFVSDNPKEWVCFLEMIWSDESNIINIKERNRSYLIQMNEFITNEYKRFLSY